MPTHLYTIPSGNALPSTTGLPEGYPFILNGVLHLNIGGTFEVAGGSGAMPVYTVTAGTYNADESAILLCDSTSNAITIVPSHESGRQLIVKKLVLENTVTIDPPLGWIDNTSTVVLSDLGAFVHLVSDGAKWYRIGLGVGTG